MSNNPYYTGDEDDDIFDNVTSNNPSNVEQHIPQYLEDALSKYLSELKGSGKISDFLSTVSNNLSIESFSLEALHSVLDTQLFVWLDDKESVMFPFEISSILKDQNIDSDFKTEAVKAEFVESLVEKSFALVQLNWLVFSKIDYMSNTVLDYIHNKGDNSQYADYNLNYIKIVNTFIKNMLSLYTTKFYEVLEEIFDHSSFQKYSLVHDNICSMQNLINTEISDYSKQEQIQYYKDFNVIINNSFDVIKQIKDELVATKI